MDVVASGWTASGQVAWFRNTWCTPGTNGTNGNAPCVACASGQYSPLYGTNNCTTCAPGTFGNVTGAWNVTSGCPGVCAPGTYSLAGAAACSPCRGGSYGDTPGMGSPNCSGLCSPGYACPAGSTSPTAVPCSPGYVCPSGSSSSTGSPCPPGSYAASPGATTCDPCPAGRFGAGSAGSNATCTGVSEDAWGGGLAAKRLCFVVEVLVRAAAPNAISFPLA